MIRNLLALTGLVALALIAAVTLQAQGYFDDFYDDAPPPREAVTTAGLDLASPAGVAELETRINHAIDRICPDDHTKSLKRIQSIRECRETAVASVRPQVDRAVALAEAKERRADRGMRRWRRLGPPPPPYYADAAPPPRWEPAPPPPPVVAPPPPPARLVRRTVVTTTTTTTTAPAELPPPVVTRRVIVREAPPPQWRPAPDRCCVTGHAPAYARRAVFAGSWLPPVAWAAIDRATVRAFRTGGLVRWNIVDRDGIERSGYVTVSAVRWFAGCPCRNVQVVKYVGNRQLVVASGMRCLTGGVLVNRAP